MSKLPQIMCGFVAALLLVRTAASPPNSRVMGGNNADVGLFPHQVSIRYLGSHVCGGSLVGRRHVLTAAQCVGDVDADGRFVVDSPVYYAAYLGSLKLYSGGRPVKVVKIVAHENYAYNLNDLAVLELEYNIYYDTEKVIRLLGEEVPAGASVVVSGWGRSSEYGNIPIDLKWTTMDALTTQQCQTAIQRGDDTLLCLSHKRNEGICYGDMGGPAVYDGKLAGVAAFVVDGCSSAKPNVFTKVSKHLAWITKHVTS